MADPRFYQSICVVLLSPDLSMSYMGVHFAHQMSPSTLIVNQRWALIFRVKLCTPALYYSTLIYENIIDSITVVSLWLSLEQSKLSMRYVADCPHLEHVRVTMHFDPYKLLVSQYPPIIHITTPFDSLHSGMLCSFPTHRLLVFWRQKSNQWWNN